MIERLRESDYQVRRGYPVDKIPYLTTPVIAVCLGKILPEGMTLKLHIFCPLKLGGETCEDTAMSVMEALSALGGRLSADACSFHESMGLFTQTVEVEFTEGSKA